MRTCCLLLLFALSACSKDDAKASSAPGPAPAASDGTVTIFVDDKPVGKIAPKEVGLWPRLDTLVPVSARRLGTWQSIAVKGKTTSSVERPSSTHPDKVAALFPGENGAPAFGMFDPVELAKHGKPGLREDSITEIRIKLATDGNRGQNDHADSAAGDPTKLELTIKTAKSEQVVKGETLLAVERQPMPGGDGEAKGWPLSTILANAGLKSYKRLRLTGEGGTNLTLEQQDLDPKTSVPFVKLNRQGALRFRVYKKQGAGWEAGADLRGLTKIEVLE